MRTAGVAAAARREHAAARPEAPVGERQQRFVSALALARRRPRSRSVQQGSDAHDRQGAAPAQLRAGARAAARTRPARRRARAPRPERRPARPRPMPPWRRRRRRSAAWSRCPARPPSGPSSSPTISTCSGATPRRHRCAKYQRAESDLSVRPISMCLASLVTRASASPASAAAASPSSTAAASPSSPCSRSRACTAASSSAMRAFGGSAHSGVGIRSILRRFSRCETILASRPAAPSRSTVSAAARSSASLLGARRGPPRDELDALAIARNTSEPRLSSRCSSPGPARARAELTVDVAHVRAADHGHIQTERARGLHGGCGPRWRRLRGPGPRCRPSRRSAPRSACRALRAAPRRGSWGGDHRHVQLAVLLEQREARDAAVALETPASRWPRRRAGAPGGSAPSQSGSTRTLDPSARERARRRRCRASPAGAGTAPPRPMPGGCTRPGRRRPRRARSGRKPQ